MRRWSAPPIAATLAALAAILALTACGPVPASRQLPRDSPSATASPSHTGLLLRAASAFMSQLQAGAFSAQWSELAPEAQAVWPSEAARSSFLAAKFKGPARLVSYGLGSPVPAGVWVDREDPAVQVGGGYRVPVSMEFANPGGLQPQGVAVDYTGLSLVLLLGAGGVPEVLGEGPASLDAPVILPASPPSESASVPILMYHVVAPFPVAAQWNTGYAYRLEYGLTVTPAQFRSQMAFLVSQGAHSVSLPRLADYLLYGLPLPSRPVVITFDDGRESPYQNAVPILTQDGFTATFFISTGLVGRYVSTRTGTNPQHYLTWPQIEQLAASGFWAEDHTLLDNVTLWGRPMSLVQQLAGQTATTLEEHTGQAVQFIAYTGVWPYPSPGTAGAPETALFKQLAQLGYVGGAVDARVDSASESTAGLWQLPRVRMNPNEPGSALSRWVG
ncbi:MAG: polysaccharide deacetylase family protein [Candidatus Dormiibacterota bacterium]